MRRRRWSAVQLYLMRPDQHAEYLRRWERITRRPYSLNELHRAARLAGGVTATDPDVWRTEIRDGNVRVVALPVPGAVRSMGQRHRDWGVALGLGLCAMIAAYLAWHLLRWAGGGLP